jgi:hypothetical protein
MSTTAAPRRTRATSVTSPTSNTRRKEVFVKDSRKVTEPITETHVALLPLRYAVAPKADAPAYRYQAANLDRGFPALDQTSYVVRELRRGFVYVFAQNTLHAFEVTAGGNLRPYRLAEGGEKIPIERAALLFPKRLGEVALAFSEHEWTAQQCQRIVSDTDAARSRSMQRVALASPGPDTFPLAELGTHVENYAGRAAEFAWSDSRASARQASTYARLTTLAEGGQFGIALADPIGITHDLSALIEQALAEIKAYVSDPDEGKASASAPKQEDSSNAAAKTQSASEIPSIIAPPAPTAEDIAKAEADAAAHTAARARYRKKLVAETIGRLYESCITPTTDADSLVRLRQEYWRRDPTNVGKPERSPEELRRDVVAGPSAARLRKHVDEEARRAFLTRYDEELAELRAVFEARRKDRIAWLASWNQPGKPHALHTAWDGFDMDDRQDWVCYELSFARSMAGMGMTGEGEGSAQTDELDLIGQWLKASLDESPVYRALAGHTPLREAAEKLETPGPIDVAADRTGSVIDAGATLIEELAQRFPYTVGTEEIVHSVTVYILHKGNFAEMMHADNFIRVMTHLTDEAAGLAYVGMLARYKGRAATFQHTQSSYKRFFREAAGDPPGLAKSLETTSKVKVQRTAAFNTFEIEEVTTKRTAIAGKAQPNPFRGWGSVGISAVAGLLYLVNLKAAVQTFDSEERFESAANLLSAAAAIGSGINAGLMAFNTATPNAIETLYRTAPLVRGLGGLYALRLFGYGGALLTGATLGIHGYKRMDAGDWDAGLWYAGSAVLATAGGSMLTYGQAKLLEQAVKEAAKSVAKQAAGAAARGAIGTAAAEAGAAGAALLTPVGWMVVGAVLVVGSIAFTLWGEEATDTPVERWLKVSSFGDEGTSSYASVTDEMNALGEALHAPQVLRTHWGVSRRVNIRYKASATVFLPGYNPDQSRLSVQVTNEGEHKHTESLRTEGGGAIVELAHERDAGGPKETTFTLNYWPTDAFAAPYSLIILVSDATETD